MPGIVDRLLHSREKAQGVGSNSHAVKYLNQDFEALRRSCLERGRLFEDECFEALPSSLGYNELGPDSYKARGITWKRPTVEWTRQYLSRVAGEGGGCDTIAYIYVCWSLWTVMSSALR